MRYERDRPGELVHVDVKKLGRIPERGGWRAHGRREEVRARGIGYDYVHSIVDDHSRLAYSEILADEKGPNCAGFIDRAADYFATQGISRIEHVNHRQPLQLPALRRRGTRHCQHPGPNTSSSSRIAHGKTARSKD